MIMYILSLAAAFWIVKDVLKDAIETCPAGSTERILFIMHRVYLMVAIGLGCTYFFGVGHTITATVLSIYSMVFIALLFPDYDRLIDLKI